MEATKPRNKTEAVEKFKLPRKLDRRVVVTPDIEAGVKADYIPYEFGYKQVAEKYGISKRTAQFIIDPERRKTCAEQFKQRRKDGRYKPKKDQWRKTIAEHRAYKFLALS